MNVGEKLTALRNAISQAAHGPDFVVTALFVIDRDKKILQLLDLVSSTKLALSVATRFFQASKVL